MSDADFNQSPRGGGWVLFCCIPNVSPVEGDEWQRAAEASTFLRSYADSSPPTRLHLRGSEAVVPGKQPELTRFDPQKPPKLLFSSWSSQLKSNGVPA